MFDQLVRVCVMGSCCVVCAVLMVDQLRARVCVCVCVCVGVSCFVVHAVKCLSVTASGEG